MNTQAVLDSENVNIVLKDWQILWDLAKIDENLLELTQCQAPEIQFAAIITISRTDESPFIQFLNVNVKPGLGRETFVDCKV
jgi:hypothetical protein